MDMWDSFIKAVKKVPQTKIVFDLFHVVSAFNRVIDIVRNDEYRKSIDKKKTSKKAKNENNRRSDESDENNEE